MIAALLQDHDPGDEDRRPDGQWCSRCGDAFDGPERDCPRPAPGRPYVDCGRGGHMFDRGRPALLIKDWADLVREAVLELAAGGTVEQIHADVCEERGAPTLTEVRRAIAGLAGDGAIVRAGQGWVRS